MLKSSAIVIIFLSLSACKITSSAPSETNAVQGTQGYENTRRKYGANGLAPVGGTKQYKVTGRTNMGAQHRNQCEAAYSGSETVKVTWTEGGKTITQDLFITGVNNRDFATSDNGVISDACGQVLEATYTINGKTIVERYVVVDRIYEDHAQGEPNLDIAAASYTRIREALKHHDNFYKISVKTIARGSYTYAENQKCMFNPYGPSPCGNGW